MTHSGQGDESRPPASRPAHEGVVLPADGSEPFIPGVSAQRVAPAGGTPWGAPWGPGQEAQPLPQEEPPGAGAPYAQPVSARTLPPQVPQHAQTPYGYGQTAAQAPGPDADATQFIAPVPPGSGDATQFIAPVPPGSGDATQYIAPARPGPGALPPESPAGAAPFPGAGPAGAVPGVPAGDGEATQYLPPVADPNASRQQTPAPPPGAPYGIRPGAPGDRQPPAEFDNLFRSDAGAGGGAEATQHLPPVREPGYGAQSPHTSHASHASQGRRAARRSAESRPSPRNSSRDSARLPLIAAVVVGCAVLGLGASALMFGGGGDDPQSANTGVAAATSPATGAAGEAAEDPVRAQAVELDKLLADSNDSRAAVIRSVESIKTCQNLDQAAADLRGAAEQRRGLVTRLQGLSVDELPDNQALTASLRKAWEASASADDHYAAWAGQVGEKKGCKGGKARSTGQTAQGNAQSGVATKAKREAATIWNRIAAKHGLTERSAEQL
ncbi:hypothetical protein OTC26_013910 [Streptomyces tirandamycinicus]|uniref:hypothetical protein n=1 Tax=Streptomyces tirandamycinicus TaxID=2174846 RepID=UPI0022714892|nr:hypothetical protein [Streptomyces tirandamycinicus]MCY0980941.1 hypothetical protein [Streptomyces tirandamycinicus]